MSMIASDWDKAGSLLASAGRVIILAHVFPDGDAIGSLVGLGTALRSVGKTVTMAIDGSVPVGLRFLPGTADVRDNLKGVEADLVIAVDCSDERRVGKMGKKARKLKLPWINLDHHQTNTLFADANIVDVNFVSAAEGVLHWLDRLSITPTRDVAQCLLCGIVTDTLGFRISSVTADTFGLAQRLMTYGANLMEIIQHTISRMPSATIKLWGQVMPGVLLEDHVAWAKVSIAARKAADYHDNSDGGLVGWLLKADDAYISCILREQAPKEIDVSLRAKPGFDVAKVATGIGGGGHVLASGATVLGTLEEVEAMVIPLLKAAAALGTPLSANSDAAVPVQTA